MDRIARFVTGKPWLVLASIAALTILGISELIDFSSGRILLEFDPSVSRMFPQETEEGEFYAYVRRLFGSDETLVVALVDKEGVFTPENLERLRILTHRLEEVKGVHHVVSLANALNIHSANGDLVIEPFLTNLSGDPGESEQIREHALANPIYSGNLVSRDGTATAIFVYLDEMTDAQFLARGIDSTIIRIAEEERGDAQVWMTGGSRIKAETTRSAVRDIVVVMPLIGLIMAIVAAIAFRTLAGVLLPLISIFVALIWTLAIIVASGRPLNLVTTIVPALILTIGFAYAVHIMSEYYDLVGEGSDSPGEGASSPAYQALRNVTLPVVLTGATTAAGFVSLTLSPLVAVREFGVFCLVAVVTTVLAALTLPPATLQLLPIPKNRQRPPGEVDRFAVLARRLAEWDLRRRTPILIAAVLVAVAAAWGTTRLRVSMDQINNFAADSSVRRDFEAINLALEGSNLFYVVLQADYRDAFKEPVNLRTIQELQRWLEEQPEIGGTTSLVDYASLINRGFHDDDPAFLAIPKSRQLVTQLLFFGANDELDSVVDSRYQTTSILVRSTVIDSGEVSSLIDRIEQHLEGLPEHLDARVTGNSVLVVSSINALSRGQALSLSAAFVLIYAILTLLFTSFRVGLIALVPNALPVLIYFGTLGITGITLSPVTSLVACIILGIAVDDTIHFLTRFSHAAKSGADEQRGVVETLSTVGRAVTLTTVALCLGFLALTTSSMRSQVEFGALAAFTLLVAWILDVTLTPALASRLRIVTLWDVLALDLGDEPQNTIPLFKGLRSAQAKVVALMADIRSLPENHQLFRVGETGDDMYVVLDGEMRVSLPTAQGNVDIATLQRGDVVGEMALFRGKRSADVATASDVRLLRLEKSHLERLRRRYPRIGAQVLDNLSEILAERLAAANARLG